MTLRISRLLRWFLISGCVGVLVALTLAAIGTSRIISPSILLALWPPSIVGIADPTNPSDKSSSRSSSSVATSSYTG